MPKLHLKSTPEEEAALRLRKQKKEAKRKRKEANSTERLSSNKRRREHTTTGRLSNPLRWASSEDEQNVDFHPQSGPSYPYCSQTPSTKQSYNESELEQRFRERMFEEMEYDERLDSLETRFNDFAHVPERWRAGSGGKPGKSYDDHFSTTDPQTLDDEEYVEWIRAAMYRKTHAKEYAEQQRKKVLDESRRAETARLEKAAEEERKQKKVDRENHKWDHARRDYELRWKGLLSGGLNHHKQELQFHDIPWPILAAHRQKPDKRSSQIISRPVTVFLEELTTEAISLFLLQSNGSLSGTAPTPGDAGKKERKDILRETLLRFHPDKFEGRFMKFVKDSERDGVRNGIGQVVRILNTLMNETVG